MELTEKERIIKAKIKLQKEYPFWGYISMKLKPINEEKVKTCAVSNKFELFYANEFIKNLTDEQLQGLLAHEIGHVIFRHLRRVDNRNPKLFNVAADIAINNILVNDNFKLPQSELIPSYNRWTSKDKKITIDELDKKNAEIIYEILKKAENEPDDKGFDKHILGKVTDKMRKEIENTIIEATNVGRLKGKLPAGLEELIGDILAPKINWKNKFRKKINSSIKGSFSFIRPNKNFLAHKLILPGRKKEKVELFIHIDTSASCSKEDLTEFVSEIYHMCSGNKQVTARVVLCDSEIQDEFIVSSTTIQKLKNIKLKGRGGTSHIPVVEYIKENRLRPTAVVTFTDGYSDIEECFPKMNFRKIIVLTPSHQTGLEKYGEVITMPERRK